MASSSLEPASRSVFLSHNGRQKPWVRRVAAQWRALGLKVFFDEDSIAPGENVVKALERGIGESTHVVLFLSPASLESRWVAMEIAMTQVQDPAAADRRLIPVLVEPVAPEAIGSSIRCLNIVNLTDEQSRDNRYRYLLQSLLGSSTEKLPPPPPFDPEVMWEPARDDAALAPNREGRERAASTAKQVGLELTIKGNLNEFTPERQASLLRAIQALLETTDEIRIRSIRHGSIILTLDLSAEEAERLYWAVENGELDDFGVERARVLEPGPPLSSTQRFTPRPPAWPKPDLRAAASPYVSARLEAHDAPGLHSAVEPSLFFIEHLRGRLVAEKGLHDLSRNAEFARFPLIGFHTSAVAVDFVAFRPADGLTESEIVSLRDAFFEAVRHVSQEFGLKPRGRNPNGLLAFVFEEGCPEPMARFIRKQTKISHRASTGAVTVAWAIDLKQRRVHTHENPVSIFPPVMIVPQTVFPGLGWLESAVAELPDEPAPEETKGTETAAPRPPVSSPPAGRVRILYLGANSSHQPLDLEREVARIEHDLRMARERDALEFRHVGAVTIDTLMQEMLDRRPNIVHFSGHGVEEGIVLRDEVGSSRLVTGKALASLFELFRDTVRCVVLNACWSEAQARAIREHVPHVVGTRAQILDQAALAFSAGFYKAIAAGRDVPFAFETGRARVHMEGCGGEDLLVLL